MQRDIHGLTAAEGEELSVWTARALVQATLAEASSFHASSTSQDDVKQA